MSTIEGKHYNPISQKERFSEKLEMSQISICLNKYKYTFLLLSFQFLKQMTLVNETKNWEFNCSSFGPPRIEFYSTLHLQFGLGAGQAQARLSWARYTMSLWLELGSAQRRQRLEGFCMELEFFWLDPLLVWATASFLRLLSKWRNIVY